MKTAIGILFLIISCHSAVVAASTQLFSNIQAGQSLNVTFTLSAPPPSPYNLLGISFFGTGISGIDSFTTEIYDGATLLSSDTSSLISPSSLRTASNPFTSYGGAPSLLADLSTLNDDGTLLGRVVFTPNFSPSGGNISLFGIGVQMLNQIGESGGTLFPESQIEITSAQIVPEPQTLLLGGLSITLLFARSRKR
jgi:hypothetical protein